MFDNIMKFFKKFSKDEKKDSKDTAKERLHLVLMQDRANVSVDFLELMKQEIIEVIKKYIDVDENLIDVKLTNKDNGDGTTGAPALYANIPIVSIKDEAKKLNIERKQEIKEENKNNENEEVEKENDKTEEEIDKKGENEQTDSEDKKENNKEEVKEIIEEKQEENIQEEKIEEPKQDNMQEKQNEVEVK